MTSVTNLKLKTEVGEAVRAFTDGANFQVCHNNTRLCYDDITSAATLLGAMKELGGTHTHTHFNTA